MVAISAIIVASTLIPVFIFFYFPFPEPEPYRSPNWVFEVVDSGQAPDLVQNPTLDVDAHGKPHIGYYSNINTESQLRYATKEDGTWHSEIAENQSHGWTWTRLDPSGEVNIVHLSEDGLKLARRSDDWTMEVVNPTTRPRFPTLTYQKNSLPIIAYFDTFNQTINVAEKTDTGWDIEDLGHLGYSPSIASGTGNDVHLLYMTSDEAGHAVRTGDGWSFETIGPTQTVAAGSISIGSDGVIHVAYEDEGVLRYASRIQNEWIIETIDTGIGGIHRHISLELLSNGHPVICYSGEDGTKIAWRMNGRWEIERIAEERGDVSMALDSSNTPHIVFEYSKVVVLERTERFLIYAYREDPLHEGSRGSHPDVGQLSSVLPSANEIQISPGREGKMSRNAARPCPDFNF